jgi:hypothetical protein
MNLNINEILQEKGITHPVANAGRYHGVKRNQAQNNSCFHHFCYQVTPFIQT